MLSFLYIPIIKISQHLFLLFLKVWLLCNTLRNPRADELGSGLVVNCPLVQTTFDQIYNPIPHRELEFRHHQTNPYKRMLFGRMFFY